jgi:hypothetical protein
MLNSFDVVVCIETTSFRLIECLYKTNEYNNSKKTTYPSLLPKWAIYKQIRIVYFTHLFWVTIERLELDSMI